MFPPVHYGEVGIRYVFPPVHYGGVGISMCSLQYIMVG